ncbi:MAG TPA: translocation/assembly module TamB domain-containing protein [Bryobacteraceae bacterium]|nr:translocation/assembly module TamB domain-containing protein [Bryobacteraceae bacterium]
MSRGWKIARNVAIGLAAFAVLVIVAASIVVHTGWFETFVRGKIIAAIEDGTGGRTEVGDFRFNESHLEANVDNLTIHGLEPADAAPFVHIRNIVVNVRLFPSLREIVNISRVIVNQPRIHVMTLADGRSNIPSPRNPSPPKDEPLKPVVDLAIGHFEINQGAVALEQTTIPLDAQVDDLKARLDYNLLASSYGGQISFAPAYVMADRRTPVPVNVRLPITIGSDRIELHHASLSTAASTVSVDGSVTDIRNPKIDAKLNATIAAADLRYGAGVDIATARDLPQDIQVAADVTASNSAIEVRNLRAAIGDSSIEASGALRNPHGSGAMNVRSQLALGQLAQLFQVPAKVGGEVALSGRAEWEAANQYSFTGDIRGDHIDVTQGTTAIRDVNLTSGIHADQNTIELKGLILRAFGGSFEGNAALRELRFYRVDGNLRGFDIQHALAIAGTKLPYEGAVSGAVTAEGDLKSTQSLTAQARLTIAPGKTGIPVSGQLDANYSAAGDNIRLRNSYLALPHTRLDLAGDLTSNLHLVLKSRDLHDILAATTIAPDTAVLNQGTLTFDGNVTGGLRAPRLTGHLGATSIAVEGRHFDSVEADLAASPSGATVSNGAIARAGDGSGMRAQFSASASLANWKLPPSAPVRADLTINPADLADLAALAGQKDGGYSGPVTVTAHVTGTAGNPLGTVRLDAGKGTIGNKPFDQAHLEANLTDRLVTIPAAWIQGGAGRANITGEFRHPADSFTTGQVQAKLTTTQLDLAKFPIPLPRNATGSLQANLNATGRLQAAPAAPFLLSSVTGDITGRGLTITGEDFGNLDLNLRTSGDTANYNASLAFGSSRIHVAGATRLAQDYPTTADATLTDISVASLLKAADRADIPAKGTLSGTAHVTGTLSNPQGGANLELTRAVLYDEPIDHIRLQASYLPDRIDLQQLQITAAGASIGMTARYDHPAGNLQSGSASFEVNSSHLDLARIHYIQTRRPGLAGLVELAAKGSGAIAAGSAPVATRLKIHDLNMNLAATGVQAQNENFGDLKLTAGMASANRVQFALESDLATSRIHGQGSVDLTAGYPVNAQLSVQNALYSKFAKLAGVTAPNQVEAALDGQVSVNGPAENPDQLRGNLQLTRVEVTAKPEPGQARPVEITNQGPITATLDRGAVQLRNVHLQGPDLDLQAQGTASIMGGPMALAVNGNVGLAILKSFDSDIYSAGNISVTANIRGTTSQPQMSGQVVLRDATFNYASLPNGISNANGTILLNGSTANIQNLTGESGGGKLTLTGFAQYGEPSRFGLQLRAQQVRVRAQQGISIVLAANVQLAGTSRNSAISGTATIDQVNYNPTTDIASLLSKATPSVQTAAAPSPILENMRLDLRVRTASGLAVQAVMAQGLSVTADLRVQGNVAQPGVLGRVNINEGRLVFLGSSFSVDAGTIAFYNPLSIDPILDISLETQTQGIQVTLRVTGPIDNMKLSYTSNPPLQFTEIVSLLATGKTPTSDPTLLANQPQVPQASFQQMGESAILGEAVANPVAGRLQRVFGVSQLKIDPAFQGGSALPTARLTLQQRITTNVTFTYTSALDDPNGEIVKIEWAFDPRWSAVATRDQNGIFSVNFFYKRQFR